MGCTASPPPPPSQEPLVNSSSKSSSTSSKTMAEPLEPSLPGYSIHDEQLGIGEFACVKTCTDDASAAKLAVKIMPLSGTASSKNALLDLRLLANAEESTWRECQGSKHIVELYHVLISDAFALFVMERCECSLLDVLISDPTVSSRFEQFYFQMLMGIQHVHSRAIVHRDVKHANFLVTYDGNLQLCDFGFAIRVDAIASATHKAVGSRLYMAPEMIRKDNYGCAVDIWSLGVTIYMITFGSAPYENGSGDNGLAQAIEFNDPLPSYIPSKGFHAPSLDIIDFIKHLLEHDSGRRKTATACLELKPVCHYKRVVVDLDEDMEFPDVPASVEVMDKIIPREHSLQSYIREDGQAISKPRICSTPLQIMPFVVESSNLQKNHLSCFCCSDTSVSRGLTYDNGEDFFNSLRASESQISI